jgi:hypothetical protein
MEFLQELFIKNNMILWRDTAGFGVENQNDVGTVIRGKPQEDASPRFLLPLWKFPCVLKSWMESINRTPNYSCPFAVCVCRPEEQRGREEKFVLLNIFETSFYSQTCQSKHTLHQHETCREFVAKS